MSSITKNCHCTQRLSTCSMCLAVCHLTAVQCQVVRVWPATSDVKTEFRLKYHSKEIPLFTIDPSNSNPVNITINSEHSDAVSKMGVSQNRGGPNMFPKLLLAPQQKESQIDRGGHRLRCRDRIIGPTRIFT